MDIREHKAYQKEFEAYSKEITASKEAAEGFLIRSGIHTPTGRLTKAYSYPKNASKKSK